MTFPNHWLKVPFGNCVDSLSTQGITLPKKHWRSSGKYPVTGQGEGEIEGYSDREDLVIRNQLPVIVYGPHTKRAKFIDYPFILGPNAKLLKPSKAWNTELLAMYLGFVRLPDRGYSDHFQFLREIELPLIPEGEQSRILHCIHELFADVNAGIEMIKKMRGKIKSFRAAVLKAAVEGNLTTAGHTFPLRRISEALESIGQGWSPKCESSSSDNPERWAVIKTTAIQPMSFVETHNKALPISLKTKPNLELKKGDLLITRAGPRSRVGVACLVKKTRPRLILCDKAYRIRCKPNTLSPAFLEVALNAPNIVAELDKLKTGISDSGLNLTQDRFADLLVPFPTPDEQSAIVEAVEWQLSLIEHLEADIESNLKSAETLRQSILREAFSGRLVQQDLNEEPAIEILKRIITKREHDDNSAKFHKATKTIKRPVRNPKNK